MAQIDLIVSKITQIITSQLSQVSKMTQIALIGQKLAQIVQVPKIVQNFMILHEGPNALHSSRGEEKEPQKLPKMAKSSKC